MPPLISGLALLASSLVWYAHPDLLTGLPGYYAFETTFSLGLLLGYEGIIALAGGEPLYGPGRRSLVLPLYLLGVVAGVFLELFSNWLFKTWVYPPLGNRKYLLNIFLFHGLYFIILLESYQAALCLVRRLIPARPTATYSPHERRYLPLLGLGGIILLVWECANKATSIHLTTPWWKTVNRAWTSPNSLAEILTVCLGLWMISEYLQYRAGSGGLLLSLLRRNPAPGLTLLLSSGVTALAYETYNLPLHLWQYLNLPYESTLVLGIPIVALALWPVQYLYFIALAHAAFPRQTRGIWG